MYLVNPKFQEQMPYKLLYLDDQVMEFDLTPNRADALSMIGTAYEVAALYNTKMTKPETTSNELELSANDELTVTIENEDKVPYYSARCSRRDN